MTAQPGQDLPDTLRRLDQMTAGRATWKAKALEMEEARDQAVDRALELAAKLAAMTARAESAEAMYDRVRTIVTSLVTGTMSFITGGIAPVISQLLQEFDKTGPLSAPSARVAAEQPTVKDPDPGDPQDGSGCPA